jgi:hypothetical protein
MVLRGGMFYPRGGRLVYEDGDQVGQDLKLDLMRVGSSAIQALTW